LRAHLPLHEIHGATHHTDVDKTNLLPAPSGGAKPVASHIPCWAACRGRSGARARLLAADIDLRVPLAGLLEHGHAAVAGRLRAALARAAAQHRHQLRLRHACARRGRRLRRGHPTRRCIGACHLVCKMSFSPAGSPQRGGVKGAAAQTGGAASGAACAGERHLERTPCQVQQCARRPMLHSPDARSYNVERPRLLQATACFMTRHAASWQSAAPALMTHTLYNKVAALGTLLPHPSQGPDCRLVLCTTQAARPGAKSAAMTERLPSCPRGCMRISARAHKHAASCAASWPEHRSMPSQLRLYAAAPRRGTNPAGRPGSGRQLQRCAHLASGGSAAAATARRPGAMRPSAGRLVDILANSTTRC